MQNFIDSSNNRITVFRRKGEDGAFVEIATKMGWFTARRRVIPCFNDRSGMETEQERWLMDNAEPLEENSVTSLEALLRWKFDMIAKLDA